MGPKEFLMKVTVPPPNSMVGALSVDWALASAARFRSQRMVSPEL